METQGLLQLFQETIQKLVRTVTSAFHLPPECTPRPGVKHSTHCKHFCVNVSYASAGRTVHLGSLLMKAGIRTSKAFIPAPFLTTQLAKRNYPEGDSGMEAILLVTIPSLSLSSSLQTKSSLQVPSKLLLRRNPGSLHLHYQFLLMVPASMC